MKEQINMNTQETQTNTTAVKTKAKTVKAKVNKTAKATKIAKPAVTLTPRQLVAIKNGTVLGKRKGSTTTGIISLKTLIASLPENTQVPVGMKFLKLMNIPVESSFVSNTKNINEIVKAAKPAAPILQVQDLNLEPAAV
jgi:hypothetical protein